MDAITLALPDVIREFLRRTEQELIPGRRWDHAEDILVNILAARNEDEFRRAALDLRDKLRKAKQRSQSWQPQSSERVGHHNGCKPLSIPQTGETIQPHSKVPAGRHREQRRGRRLQRPAPRRVAAELGDCWTGSA